METRLMSHVLTKKDRRCFIRGKFKGRGKRDNIIEVDKWVLIGLREFQQAPSELVLVNGKKEMEMCDLLEVYSSSEKETLKRTHGVYMKESELSRSVAATAASEETLQFVDMDTLRYQKIASEKVETIRLKAEQRKINNNVIDQSAFYSDIDDDDSDDDCISDRDLGDDDSDGNVANKKISSSESDNEEQEEESDREEEEEQKNKKWNKNKRGINVYKEEIDVDDI